MLLIDRPKLIITTEDPEEGEGLGQEVLTSRSWRSWDEEEGTGDEVGVASDWARSEVNGGGGLG